MRAKAQCSKRLPRLRCARLQGPSRSQLAARASSAATYNHLQESQVGIEEVANSQVALSARAAEGGTVMFQIPDSHWLSLKTVSSSATGDATKDEPAWLRFAVFLIAAEAAGDAIWGEYLAAFEASGSHPVLLWDEAALKRLEGSQVMSTAVGYKSFFEMKHKEIKESILPKLDSAAAAACTPDRFVLAAAAVRARLLPPFSDKDPCLFIGTELMQHSRRANVQLQRQGGSLFDRSQTLQVVATRALASEEPLYLDFAPDKLESQVVLDYGVYGEQAASPGYMLTLSIPGEDADTCHFDKLDILEQQGMGASETFTLKLGEPPSEEMLAFVRLMNVSGQDAFLMEAIFRGEAWGHMCDPISRANEEAVCKSMASGCAAALQAYPSSLADDIKAKSECSKEDAPEAFLALQVCMDEKRMLSALQQWFEQRLEAVETLEFYQERRLKRLGLLDDDGESTFEDMIQINI